MTDTGALRVTRPASPAGARRLLALLFPRCARYLFIHASFRLRRRFARPAEPRNPNPKPESEVNP